MASASQKALLLKLFSVFSVVRGYNVAVVVVAEYLASIYIFSEKDYLIDVLLDWKLFLYALSSSLAIASGYIINNFYDKEKDIINRPGKFVIDQMVSKDTKLRFYFFLNFLSASIAWLISFKTCLFISIYIFCLWFYSHKIKRFPIIGNLWAAVLALLPFLGLLIYFQNYDTIVFLHASFLFLLLWIREIAKDLQNLKGDFANNYRTIAVRFGTNKAKIFISFLTVIDLLAAVLLIFSTEVGYMKYYLFFAILVFVVFIRQLWKASTRNNYISLHLILKLLLLLGVLSLVLIRPLV